MKTFLFLVSLEGQTCVFLQYLPLLQAPSPQSRVCCLAKIRNTVYEDLTSHIIIKYLVKELQYATITVQADYGQWRPLTLQLIQ